MDLDELLAALQAAAGTPAVGAPLITTDLYVPVNSNDPAADRDAARRMVASFAFWLVAYDTVAPDAPPARAAILSTIASRSDESASVVEELGDRLLPSDVHADWKGFAAAYLAPGGSLGDDYWKLFVEAPGRRTLRDAHPTRSDYERLARQIQTRAERFRQGASDWRTPVEVPGAPQPSLWTGGTKDEWLRRIATYEDLEGSLPLHHRARIEEFWSLVDAAPSMPDLDVATALARTCLWGIDSSVQQSVYGALGGLPPGLRLRGVLAHIVEIEAKTDESEQVVDVFPDDLEAAELVRLAEGIEAAPLDQRAAYSRALMSAKREGSRHAARLLRVLRRRART